jgi:hypothetical protein
MTVGTLLTADQASDLLTGARAVQLPVLATALLVGCAAKTRRAVSLRSIDAGIGPTMMFPDRLRRPIAILLLAGEFLLGVGLLLTAGRIGAGAPALAVRSATALLFGTAVAALYVLREHEPDAGCGCFGDLSHTPVSWQSLTRSVALCLAAIATLGMRPLALPASGKQAVAVLVILAIELSALAALSPEVSEIMVRLGYSEPCEVRRLPVSRTLSALRGSSHWRRYRRYLVSEEPVDVWREGCWRYVVFPAMLASRRVEVVFAVYLKPRRAPVRAGIFDATADKRTKEAADNAAAAIIANAIPAQRKAQVSSPAAAGAVARTASLASAGAASASSGAGADGSSGAGAGESSGASPGHPAPVVLSTRPHGVARDVPHRKVHAVSRHRQRHSAGF